MSRSNIDKTSPGLLDEVLSYIKSSSGLTTIHFETGYVHVKQKVDGKTLSFHCEDLNEILKRTDTDGKPFIQVNFHTGRKILFTDSLIGFKPIETIGLDMGRIPKVVTTPDLLSVFEAIEETLSQDVNESEVDTLKKVFNAILVGGELAGFDLKFERGWLNRLSASKFKASA